MKTMKVALLATAALAAVSVSARADDTAAIKAQLEALTARIAQLEAAPAAPVGYSLLTLSQEKAIVIPGLEADKNYGEMAHNIGILPTADAPASTDIQWSGYVRAAIVYQEDGHEDFSSNIDDDIDVYARGELTVVAKTETAVGEVGVKMVLRANFDGDLGQGEFDPISGDSTGFSTYKDVVSPEAWGWWAMTPELTFGGGYAGSLASIGYGVDGACTCMYTDNGSASALGSFGDTTQLRLTYASGPLSFAIALEDGSVDDDTGDDISDNISGDTLGVAGEIKYAGDTVSGEIAGAWRDGGSHTTNTDDIYRAAIGIGFALGDMLALSMDAVMGSGTGLTDDFWGASALATVNLSDAVYAELGVAFLNPEGSSSNDEIDYLAGLYYNPVDQLTIGLEAELVNPDGGGNNALTAAFVSRWRF